MSTSTETLGPAARRRRNRQIAAARTRGETWKTIGKRFGISDRQARRAAAEAHEIEAELVDGADTEGVLRHVAEVQLRALNHLDQLMGDGPDNHNALVGAARGAASVGAAILDTWRAAGALPDPSSMRVAGEVRTIVEALVRVAQEEGIDPNSVLARLDEEPTIRSLGVAAAVAA